MQLLFIIKVLFSLIHLVMAQRRIIDGKPVSEDKKYVVYLTKASGSPANYDYWICGGAIVTEWFIVTSAACVEDVRHLYAIAGYRKYVKYSEIFTNPCTNATRKRIVFVCIPKLHEFEYPRVEKWAQVDIAVVKVDKKYDFENIGAYGKLCHYHPQPIQVSYDRNLARPGLDVQVYGWGHAEKWRKPNDRADYNQETLHFASTTLYDKEVCKAYFSGYKNLGKIIDTYMICTMEPGNIDDAGRQILKRKPALDGCLPVPIDRTHSFCQEDETVPVDYRRQNFLSRILRRQQDSRRSGICQNDHGGPLVAWSGANEVLIGVASVFRVTVNSTCTGPFLYTSTDCNSAFLDCILNVSKSRRYDICDQPPSEKGFDTVDTNISWDDHPDGPANIINEMIKKEKFMHQSQRPNRPRPCANGSPYHKCIRPSHKSKKNPNKHKARLGHDVRNEEFESIVPNIPLSPHNHVPMTQREIPANNQPHESNIQKQPDLPQHFDYYNISYGDDYKYKEYFLEPSRVDKEDEISMSYQFDNAPFEQNQSDVDLDTDYEPIEKSNPHYLNHRPNKPTEAYDYT